MKTASKPTNEPLSAHIRHPVTRNAVPRKNARNAMIFAFSLALEVASRYVYFEEELYA
jgi:hypothetical protein